MELMKQEKPLELKFEDVKFYIKPRATAFDIFTLRMNSEMNDGVVSLSSKTYYNGVIKSFILGWEGVTIDGKPVPYAWDLLITLFPKGKDKDVFFELLDFILKNTDLTYKQEELKKE
jgi:hypothetical protein